MTGRQGEIALPLQADGVTASWATAALGVRYPGTEVGYVEIARVLSGSATKVWLNLEYASNPYGEESSATLLLKTGFNEAMLTLAARGYAREALFYRKVAPEVGFEVPRCYFAGTDTSNGQSALLPEDLNARQCTFGHIDEPMTVDQAGETLSMLAGLHARYLGRDKDSELVEFNETQWRHDIIDFLLGQDTWNRCLDAPRGATIPRRFRDRERIVRAFHNAREHENRGLRTLLHGDAHLGNLYYTAEGSPRLLDWQAASFSSWAFEIAYHIVCVLDVEDRRRSERDLLRRYLDELAGTGHCEVPGFEAAWTAYRQQVIYGFSGWLCTLEMQTEDFAISMGGRFMQAIDDLETLAALGC